MEFTLTQDFPAGLDLLWAAFGRADYPRLKYLALGAMAVRLPRFSATAQAIARARHAGRPVPVAAMEPRLGRQPTDAATSHGMVADNLADTGRNASKSG